MKLNLLKTNFILICISFFAYTSWAQPIAVGTMKGDPNVTAAGVFTYSIPILLPPGIGTMAPKLSLDYNSQAGNGLLGIGWSLSGVSSIARIPTNLYYDLEVHPVAFNANDALALDGQRLINTGSGSYHSSVENFSLIQSYGITGSGPTFFVSESKDGLIYEYGFTGDSRMNAPGSAEVMMWAIDKVSDRNGNYIEYHYFNDPATGVYYIDNIKYTGNIGTIPSNEIDFGYETRGDNNIRYFAGSAIQGNERLSNITIRNSASLTPIHRYDLIYNEDFYSHLVKVTETGETGNTLPSTVFDWGYDAPHNEGFNTGVIIDDPATTGVTIGDFDGDGYSDCVAVSGAAASYSPSGATIIPSHYKFYDNNKGNDFDLTSSHDIPYVTSSVSSVDWRHTVKNNFSESTRMSLDFNGDGKEDLLTTSFSDAEFVMYVHLSNGTGFDSAIGLYSNGGGSDKFSKILITTGDFLGNGKQQVYLAFPDDPSSGAARIYYNVLIGDGGFMSHDTMYGERKHFQGIDFDGDGKDELFTTTVESASKTKIYSFSTTIDHPTLHPVLESTHITNIFTSAYPTMWHKIFFGDFNGDGKKDLLTWSGTATPWEIAYSTGTGFDVKNMSDPSLPSLYMGLQLPDPDEHPENNNILVGDFNGDGKDDILEMYHNFMGDYFIMYYAKGDYTFVPEPNLPPDLCGIYENKFSVGDFNGDGQADLLSHNFAGCYMRIIYFHKNEQKHLIHVVDKQNNIPGHEGHKFSVSYLPMPQDPDYTMASCTYPFCNLAIGGLKVAKTLQDNITMRKSFAYTSGAVYHKTGLGFRGYSGFVEFDSSNNRQTSNIYNLFDFETVLPSSVKVLTMDSAVDGISSSTYSFQQDVLSPDNIRIIYPLSSWFGDNINNTQVTTSYAYSPAILYTYGLPDKITTVVPVQGALNEVTTKEIIYNTGDPYLYNRFKPQQTTITVNRGLEPAYIRKAEYEYFYTGNVYKSTFDPGTAHQNTFVNTYDGFGNLTQEIHIPTGLPFITKNYVYTTDGRFLQQSINPLTYSSSFTYDTWGNVLTSQDINSLVTTYQYDDFNRIISTTSPTGVVSNTSYQWANTLPSHPITGNPSYAIISTTTGIDGSQISYYDFYGRKLRSVSTAFDGQLIYTDAAYAPDNTVTSSTEPYFSTMPSIASHFTYDGVGRITYAVTPTATVSTAYHTEGEWGVRTVARNTSAMPYRVKASATDGTGKLMYVTEDSYTDTIQYAYFSNGKLKTSWGTNAYTRSYTYDDYGNETMETAPNKGSTVYAYNALDQLTYTTDANGVTYTFAYDLLGRTVVKTNLAGGAYNYTYGSTPGSLGKQLHETAPDAGTYTHYDYDAFSRLTGVTQSVGGLVMATGYTYDGYNRLATTTYPTGDVVQKDYNSYGYLSALDLMGGTGFTPLWQKTDEDVYGHTTSAYYGAGMYHETTDFNANGTLTGNQMGSSAGLTVSKYAYSFDEATGDLGYRKDLLMGLKETFTYDGVDRLTSITQVSDFTGTIGTQTLSFSAYGDILTKSDISPDVWHYDKHAVSDITNPTTVIPTFRQEVTYTPFHKVKTIRENDKMITFAYRADDQRGMAQYADTTGLLLRTRYYAGSYEKTVDAATGSVQQVCYIYAEGRLVAMRVNNAGVATTRYVHTDYLGSITHILDDAGGVVEEKNYDAWGRLRNPANWSYTGVPAYAFDRGYTGEELLRDFNIINLNGRLYDPLIGRMMSVDPVIGSSTNAQSYNGYTYALNNPLKYTDNSGNNPVGAMLLGAGMGGYAGYNVGMAKHAKGYDMVGYVLGGAAIGATAALVGYYAGGAVNAALDGCAMGSMAGGASAGFAGGFINGAGTAWLSGSNINDALANGMEEGTLGGAMGAFMESLKIEPIHTSEIVGVAAKAGSYILPGSDPDGTIAGSNDCVNPGKKMCLPSFDDLWRHYPPDIDKYHHARPSAGNWPNQCAIRLGYDLQQSGVDMSSYPQENTTKEGYPRYSKGLADWLERMYGMPKKIPQATFQSEYWNQRGIIYIAPPPNGIGHIDLFNAGQTGSGYYRGSEIWFWNLK